VIYSRDPSCSPMFNTSVISTKACLITSPNLPPVTTSFGDEARSLSPQPALARIFREIVE
jgi:hypothetical protein